MLTKTKDEMDAVKAMADELKGIKLAKPTSGGPINADTEAALKASLDAARAASEEFGKDSVEAKLAWETVEEVAASASDSEASRAPRKCSLYLFPPRALFWLASSHRLLTIFFLSRRRMSDRTDRRL